MSTALNLGCGTHHLDIEGYDKTLNVDVRPEVKPDVIADLFSLPVDPASVGLVHMSHVLEHFTGTDGRRLLRYIHTLLEPGGKIWIVVPSLEYASMQILRDGKPNATSYDILFGHQEYPQNFHKFGFTLRSLKEYMEITGLWRTLSCKHQDNKIGIEYKGERCVQG